MKYYTFLKCCLLKMMYKKVSKMYVDTLNDSIKQADELAYNHDLTSRRMELTASKLKSAKEKVEKNAIL